MLSLEGLQRMNADLSTNYILEGPVGSDDA